MEQSLLNLKYLDSAVNSVDIWCLDSKNIFPKYTVKKLHLLNNTVHLDIF